MLTAQRIKSMDDERLLASARAEVDPLTSTTLEIELLERFERLLNWTNENKPLVDLLHDQGIYEQDKLKAFFEQAADIRNLAEDARDFFTSFNYILTNNKE